MNNDRLELKKPIWGSGLRGHESFGIANYRLKGEGIIEVECIYKNRFGNRVFPSIYRISKEKARTFPVQTVNGGVKLHVIPKSEFEEIPG